MARGAARACLIGACLGIASPATAQSPMRPILVRPAPEHPNCQIYLKLDGSRLLYRGKPIAAGGNCPSEYMPGTVTRIGPDTYKLKVSGSECTITAAGLVECR